MATKITSNEASLVLNDGKSTIPRGDFTAATNPKGMVQVRSNNLVVTWDLDPATTTVDGESFETGKELADKLSSFSTGGGTGEGVQWDDVENKPLKTLETPIEDAEGLIPVYTQNGQLPVGIPEFPENAVPLVYLDQRLSELGGAKVESFQHTAAGGMGETFTHNTGDPTVQAVVLVPQNQTAIESGDPIYTVADGIITITVTATSAGDVLEYSYVAGTDISESSIVNDLTSTATDKALSANQGRVLDEKISEVEGMIPDVTSVPGQSEDVAASQKFVTGVKSELSETSDNLQKGLVSYRPELDLSGFRYIASNGGVGTSPNEKYNATVDFMPLDGATGFHYKGRLDGAAAKLAFYANSNLESFISVYPAGSGIITDADIPIPNGANYWRGTFETPETYGAEITLKNAKLNVKASNIVDSLDSESVEDSLAANQGKVLNDKISSTESAIGTLGNNIGEVDDRVDTLQNNLEYVVTSEEIVVETEVIESSGGVRYGNVADYFGWGWAGKAHRNIKSITVKIGIRSAITKYRMIVRKNGRDGAILIDEERALSLAPQFPYTLTHEFDVPIANTDADKLYYTLFADGGIYIYIIRPGVVFTQAAGYPKISFSSTVGAIDLPDPVLGYPSQDFYDDVDYSLILIETEDEIVFSEPLIEEITGIVDDKIDSLGSVQAELPNENMRYSFAGSSVTWGDGYLQSGFVAKFIEQLQANKAKCILPFQISETGLLSNRKYFLGSALKITGSDSEIEFNLEGNEVTIVQAIERSNQNASEIEIYVDDVLLDTFDNFNHNPIGSETKNFIGDGTAVMFDLGLAFTYGHTVTVGGSAQVVTHNISQGLSFVIPASSDCAIVRKLGKDTNGKTAVTHWVWFKNAPANDVAISVSYSYGESLFYEKTTIGEDASGNNECPYGDGDVSFDPTAPSGISSGLDFRQTEDRVLKTYRFLEWKERKVRLKIKGLYRAATGTPYFIFNFATNRFFHFQNAGIGGWDLWQLEKNLSQEYLRAWQRVVEFNPNKLLIECTPNDDWRVKGHKIYETKNMSLTQLRSIRNMPLRSISYQSGNDTYDFSKWRGTITGITETSVTYNGTVDTPIAVGDVVMIGTFWANNFDYAERVISYIDGNTINFNKPISDSDSIYGDIQGFVGKEIGVRTLDLFTDKLQGLIDKIRGSIDVDIYLLENPMPAILMRELWGYPIIMDMVANQNNRVHSINYASLRKWQEGQDKISITLDISTATNDSYLGKRVIEFSTEGRNIISADVIMDGASIYGRVVVQSGLAYSVNKILTGAALNKLPSQYVNSGQVRDRKPRLVILDDTITTGQVTVVFANKTWSNDSCHMDNSNGSILFSDFLKTITTE